MVAAHRRDLEAARNLGLRTGFIHRPDEYGNGRAGVADKAKPSDFDVVSTSAIDLAQQLRF
jgi:2-haloacid dehalogenase